MPKYLFGGDGGDVTARADDERSEREETVLVQL